MLDEVVSGQVAIEFRFGFVQSAVCCHIHQARILRWMDGMCEDRNDVRAKLRRSELLGDWVKDKVGRHCTAADEKPSQERADVDHSSTISLRNACPGFSSLH
jgi:hypothetical protein